MNYQPKVKVDQARNSPNSPCEPCKKQSLGSLGRRRHHLLTIALSIHGWRIHGRLGMRPGPLPCDWVQQAQAIHRPHGTSSGTASGSLSLTGSDAYRPIPVCAPQSKVALTFRSASWSFYIFAAPAASGRETDNHPRRSGAPAPPESGGEFFKAPRLR